MTTRTLAAVAALGCYDEEARVVTRHASDPAAALPAETEVAIRLLALTRTAAAAIARARQGKPALQPDPELSFAANYLYMMNGERPDAATERVMRERGDFTVFHEPFLVDYYVHRAVREMPMLDDAANFPGQFSLGK